MLDKIASSPTLAGLAAMLNKYFYSTSYTIAEDLTVSYSKGVNERIGVKKMKGRYIAYYK